MTLADEVVPVRDGMPPVCPPETMGYRFAGAEVVGWDYGTGMFFLDNGDRVNYVQVVAEELTPPSPMRSSVFPSLGKYATCWLGDCIVTSLTGRRVVVRTTCGKYAVSPRLMRPLQSTCTLYGVRVRYGADRCLVFPTLTVCGGAAALLEDLRSKMREMGVRTSEHSRLLEMQSVDGPSVSLRHINVNTRLLLHLVGDISGTATRPERFGCFDAPSSVALAHVQIEDYLRGNPWALPISHELLCQRLGVPFLLDPTLIAGPYTSDNDVLHLEAPQRAISCRPFEVDAEMIVLGVRAGRLEPQRDGTFAMPYAHGGWGQVVARGPSLRDLTWKMDDAYDACLPLGTHKIDIPGCPPCLLLERFGGEHYDPDTQTVHSTL